MNRTLQLFGLSLAAALFAAAPAVAVMAEPAWLSRFEDFATSPDAFRPGNLAAIRALAPLDAFQNDPCTHMFALADPHPPFLEGATVLAEGNGNGCPDASLTAVLATFYTRLDPGSVLAVRNVLTARLGLEPRSIDDGANKTLHWQLTPAHAVEIVVFPGAGPELEVSLSVAQAPRLPR